MAETLTYAQRVRIRERARKIGCSEADWLTARALARAELARWMGAQKGHALSPADLARAAASAAAQLLRDVLAEEDRQRTAAWWAANGDALREIEARQERELFAEDPVRD